jgi:hypothetical protein
LHILQIARPAPKNIEFSKLNRLIHLTEKAGKSNLKHGKVQIEKRKGDASPRKELAAEHKESQAA